MTRTRVADTRRRETIAWRRECEGRTSGQLRRSIGGILGETGKVKCMRREERG